MLSPHFRIDAGRVSQQYCDGLNRRSFVQIGVAGMASVGLPAILRAKSASAATKGTKNDTSVILIWLDGGPSHMDLYDLKPEAPAEYRGIWKPIKTNVPGIEISELFPLQARVADKFSIVRSLHHDSGDHFAGGHMMLTSRPGATGANTTGKSPSIGSIVARMRGANRRGMPAYVAVPMAASIGLVPGYFGANYLGSSFDPFQTGGDPNQLGFQVNNLNLAGGLSIPMLDDRKLLMRRFDTIKRTIDQGGTFESLDKFNQDAFELVSGPSARKAFDLNQEDPRLRDQYGRHTWGQSVLLARRLVEAGTTFVTCHFGGWDHHWNLKAGMEGYLPIVDAAVATLLRDLEVRGLSENVLVVLCGEFSRTPKMNDGGNGGPPGSMGTPGRDHWGNVMFCLLAGGGLANGVIVGSSDRLGQNPKDRPLTPGDVHATIYHALGIDPETKFLDHSGRPVAAIDYGKPITELV